MKNRSMGGLHYGMILPKLRTTLLVLPLLAAATAWACQVPVFRYALERWEPGSYRVRAPEAMKADPHAAGEVEKVAGPLTVL